MRPRWREKFAETANFPQAIPSEICDYITTNLNFFFARVLTWIARRFNLRFVGSLKEEVNRRKFHPSRLAAFFL